MSVEDYETQYMNTSARIGQAEVSEVDLKWSLIATDEQEWLKVQLQTIYSERLVELSESKIKDITL